MQQEQDKDSLDYFIRRFKGRDLQMAYELHNSVSNHLESFNFIYEQGLQKIVDYLQPLEIKNQNEQNKDQNQQQQEKQSRNLPFNKMKIWFQDLTIGYPTKTNDYQCHDAKLYPSECRISGKTYNAPLLGTVVRQINDEETEKITMNLGEIPIMVRSKHCHLYNLNGQQMVNKKEDANEYGGYFVLNGLEKLIRMLIIQKRNYPLGFIRNSYMNRQSNFTGFAVQMRSVREDLYQRTITLHYLSDGGICARLIYRKQEFLIPFICILRGLVQVTDKQIMLAVLGFQYDQENYQIIKDRLEMLLKNTKQLGILSQQDNLTYLGSNFRNILSISDPSISDLQVGQIFLKEHVLVNLEKNSDKFDTLCLMASKLYLLAADKISPDNLDTLNTQEVLLPGHLYMMVLREKIEELLQGIQLRIYKDSKSSYEASKILERGYLKKCIEQQSGIGRKMEYFLATGNLKSQSGLDLMQQNGFVVQADKINNMRFLANFRSIHRGAYFAEMKTTTVRKLFPEQWGFICPVHTPDGSPCGLLNHLSMKCHVICKPTLTSTQQTSLLQLFITLGMIPNNHSIQPNNTYFVLFDAKLVGYVYTSQAEQFVQSIRYLKIHSNLTDDVYLPNDLEVVLVNKSDHLQKQPLLCGIYINSNEARFVRPVKHLASNKTEFISPFEQLFMSIACLETDLRNDTTHMEYEPQYILSILASNVPLLVHNQSPRNMYQCQMAKQTLGTPYHNGCYRFDNKSFVYTTPQIPLVKPDQFEKYGMADYPSGVNAVVAVISYTGYDMEDAMIINKSSYERGFAHASVYKSKRYQLNDEKGGQFKKNRYKLLTNQDGVPAIGTLLKKGDCELQVLDQSKQEIKSINYKDQEVSRLDQVCLYSNVNNDFELVYKYRYQRNPIIGDKFSSRHGQKGVLSTLLPQIDMPFTEQGICPDIIINPNAFPSRMTIAMLIESLAGKQGAMDGQIHTTVPFESYENDDATGYFGSQLTKHGYRYYGTEVMYSGLYGNMMECEIYLGVVYYQRLRHMVNDKYQARATGPVDVLTQQPVKGRKKHGGIRLGEMERDALLAHGVSFILHDRLINCSDYSQAYICSNCGDILSTYLNLNLKGAISLQESNLEKSMLSMQPMCKVCKDSQTKKVAIPFVLRYLTNELAAMNIKLTFLVK